MPTSVAHMIGGYAALESGARRSPRPGIFFLFLVVIVANLPDLDFLPGVLVGDAALFHRGASHSLVAAVVVALALGAALRGRAGGFKRVAACAFLAYGSHLVLDMIVPDPSGYTAGVPLLWPLVESEIGAPIPGLGALDPLRWFESYELQDGFFHAMLSLGGVRVFLMDAALVSPLVPLAWGVRRMRVRRRRRLEARGSALPLRGRAGSVRIHRGSVVVGAEARSRVE